MTRFSSAFSETCQRMRKRSVSEALRSNDGAIDLASIMVGVLVIGIIGGVISATVFAVVPWSQDEAATANLSAVATAEETAYVYEDPNVYFAYDSHPNSDYQAVEVADIGIQQPAERLIVETSPTSQFWVAAQKSVTGKIFYRTGGKPDVFTIVPGDLAPGDLAPNADPNAPGVIPPKVISALPPEFTANDIRELLDDMITGDAHDFGTIQKPGFGVGAPNLSAGGTPAAPVTPFLATLKLTDGTIGAYSVSRDGFTSVGGNFRTTVSGYNQNAVLNGVRYFTAETMDRNQELWKFDGTTATIAANIFPDDPASTTAKRSSPRYFAKLGEKIYFSAHGATTFDQSPTAGAELWSFDGTTAKLEADIRPGSSSSQLRDLITVGSNVYFQASDSFSNFELWKFDGTTATKIEINPTSAGSYPSRFASVNGKLIFTASDGVSFDNQLFSYDGSTLAAIAGPTNPTEIKVIGDKAYFNATSSAGSELWVTDGITASLAADIVPGAGNSNPSGFVGFEGKVYFQASAGNYSDTELFSFDGVTATKMSDISPGTGSSSPSGLTVVGSRLYFTAYDADYLGGLYMLSGGAVTAVPGAPAGAYIVGRAGGDLFFTANVGGVSQLWTYDGAAAPRQVGSIGVNEVVFHGVIG